MIELKPCPNPECDDPTSLILRLSGHWQGNDEYINYWVRCQSCDAEGPTSNDDDEARRLWNLLPRTEDIK